MTLSLLIPLMLSVSVQYPATPVVADRPRNILAEITVTTDVPGNRLDGIEFVLGGLDPGAVARAELVGTGTMSVIGGQCWALREENKRIGGGSRLWYDPSFSTLLGSSCPGADGKVSIPASLPLRSGENRMYISLQILSEKLADLSSAWKVDVRKVLIDGKPEAFTEAGSPVKRTGIKVRQHGDDGVYAYRIPGLVTTTKGTLISVYDVRYFSSLDLQNDIDIGVSRSTDGGRSWEKMQIVMDMGCYGGLPEAQNGVGDPAVLVDTKTGRIWIIAVWTHGMGVSRAWENVGQGFTPEETAQLMLAWSDDDGLSWSTPKSITPQIKQKDWYFTFQGPGRGICTDDGTLVFPFQHIGPDRKPASGIIYSTDRGESWHTHASPHPNTTESAVAALPDGSLMLNMRNNLKTGRIVYTTMDLGKTWREHPSSGKLVEPVCMASLISVPAKDNILGRDLLLFSNPAVPKGRNHLTLKVSTDGGVTWNEGLLLDEDELWGYSCLSMIDRETVGILYESSQAQLLFQQIKLKDLMIPEEPFRAQLLPEIPDAGYAKGVSAPYTGVLGKNWIVAGGANFPDKPLLEGGAKKVYPDIWSLTPGQAWTRIGSLPDAAAYGSTFSFSDGLILCGGSIDGKPSSAVYQMKVRRAKAQLQSLPALPDGIAEAGWSCDGKNLYIAGGVTASGASDAVYSCRKGRWLWQKVATLPVPMVQPVLFAAKGKLYVWGGFNPVNKEVIRKGWCLDTAKGIWREIPGVPDEGTFVGASAVTLKDGRLMVTGGVDAEIFQKALLQGPEERIPYLSQPPAAYRFRDTVWVFDPASEEWSLQGACGRTALAGAGLAVCGSQVMVAGGEIKPGVRSPYIFTLECPK